MHHDVAGLFHEEPMRWSLRGDPYLWQEMRERFAGVPMPPTFGELEAMVGRMFEELTGEPISHADFIFVRRYAHGGMSSGRVVPQFWRETVLPLLCMRYEAG
jgi:hypothetical protein